MADKQQKIQDAIRRRQGGGKSPQRASNEGGSAPLNFYTGEVSSLKVQPNTVLIISLIYLGIVVFLHIISKIRSGGPEAPQTDQ